MFDVGEDVHRGTPHLGFCCQPWNGVLLTGNSTADLGSSVCRLYTVWKEDWPGGVFHTCGVGSSTVMTSHGSDDKAYTYLKIDALHPFSVISGLLGTMQGYPRLLASTLKPNFV